MPTERIDIQVREQGTRTVRRRLESIGDVATRSTRGLRLLQNALFVLGGAGVVRGLLRVVDSLTSFENRLRIVTNTTRELNAVQAELFNLAQSTRAGFDSVAETYARTALSVRFLGLSQREVLDFTESLTQAAILSGASVRETNAALVQLGQGLASNRLSGDELRSVLEQLPFVADIIARQLDTTRGGLRDLAKEGRVTTQVILDAFTNAADEIQESFDSITPTIGQALQVLSAGFLRVLDAFDDAVGGSESVARAIVQIGNNADIITTTLITLGGVIATIFIARGIGLFISSMRVASQEAQILAATVGFGARVQEAQAAAQARATVAAQAAAQQKVRELALERLSIQQRLINLMHQRAQLAITVENGRARSVLTGQFVRQAAIERLLAINQATTLRLQQALTASNVELTAAVTARTAAVNAAAAAEARLATAATAATAATTGLGAQLARAFPTTTLLVGQLRDSFSALFGILRAHPLIAIAAAIVAVSTAILGLGDRFVVVEGQADSLGTAITESVDDFGNRIQEASSNAEAFRGSYVRSFEGLGDFIEVASNETVTLRDAFIATFQLAIEEVQAFGRAAIREIDLFLERFGVNLEEVGRFFDIVLESMVNGFRTSINFMVGLAIGFSRGLGRVFGRAVDNIINIWSGLNNAFVDFVEFAIRGVISGFRDALRAVGKNSLADLLNPESVDLSRYRFNTRTLAGNIASIFAEELTSAVGVDYLSNISEAILNRARENIRQRQADLDTEGQARATTDFAQYLMRLERETLLLGLNADEREVGAALIKAERTLKRQLTEGERDLLSALIRSGQELSRQRTILDDILEPTKEYAQTLASLETLLNTGAIEFSQYAFAVRELSGTFNSNLAALERETDLLRLTSREREVANAVISTEANLKRVLTEDENRLIAAFVRGQQAVRDQTELFEEINEPANRHARTVGILTELYTEGRISVLQFSFAIRELQGTFANSLVSLQREGGLLLLNREERERATAILSIERELKRLLTEEERLLIDAVLRSNQALADQASLYDQITQPLDTYNRSLQALQALYDSGRISQDAFTQEIRNVRIAFLETQRDSFSGFERGFLRLIEQTSDFASQTERIITSAYDGIGSSLADLVVEGKLSFRSLVNDISRQLIRLATNQIFVALLTRFGGSSLLGDLGSFSGIGGSGAIAGSAFGFQRGGAFTVPGTGGPDSRLVRFRATPGERVSIETPNQQRNNQVVVNVYNQAAQDGYRATARETSGPSGERVIEIMVGRALGNLTQSGEIDPVMGVFGGDRQLVGRT